MLALRRKSAFGPQIAVAALSGNSLRQTVHTHCASVHQVAKMVAALLRVAGVTAGLAESYLLLCHDQFLVPVYCICPLTQIAANHLHNRLLNRGHVVVLIHQGHFYYRVILFISKYL